VRETVREALDAEKPREQSVWGLVIAPTVWALHFLLSYGTAAIYCSKFGVDGTPVRIAVAVYTVVALVIIGLTGLRAYRTWGGVNADMPPLSHPGLEERRRFIGFATLLLSTMSFIGTVYVALPALIFETCR
jgi:hypothetical protein